MVSLGKKMKIFFCGYWGCITLCLMLLIFCQGKDLSATEISGSISIPFSAPTGGVDVDIYVEEMDSYSHAAQKFTILNGNTSVNFTLGHGDATTSVRVRYVCLTNCGDIYPVGYVSPTNVNATGISYRYEEARIFTTDTSGINMDLPLGFRVNGQVKLPAPDNAESNIGVDVTAEQVDNFYPVSTSISISAGGSSAGYSLLLPPDPSGHWWLSYSIPSKNPLKYYHTGYYVDSVSTTYISTKAVKLLGSRSYSNANLILLRGRTIAGSISLPAGRIAPAGGLEIRMTTYQYTVYGGDDQVTVTIPEGRNSENYALVMPYDQYNSWYVRYDCRSSTCKDEVYLSQGHYAGPSQPTFFVHRDGYGALWGAESHTGIDLTLIPAKRIGGNLNIPKPAPPGGLSLMIYADDPVYPGANHDFVNIPAGAKNASYTVLIPADPVLNWRVSHFFFDNKSGYVQTAYYAVAGTTHLFGKATLLNGGMDHYHIDMNAIPDKDNDGIPDSIDPVNNNMNPGVLLLLRQKQQIP